MTSETLLPCSTLSSVHQSGSVQKSWVAYLGAELVTWVVLEVQKGPRPITADLLLCQLLDGYLSLGCPESGDVDKFQDDHSLPVLPLPLAVQHKIQWIKIADWRGGVSHQPLHMKSCIYAALNVFHWSFRDERTVQGASSSHQLHMIKLGAALFAGLFKEEDTSGSAD